MAKRATKKTATVAANPNHDHDYSALLISARSSFNSVAGAHEFLFRTDADELNNLYLVSLPSERQIHNCSCCRRFIETYGGLVAITENGEMIPAMWNPEGVPEFYRPAFAALFNRVKRARITSIFHTKEKVWGSPETGAWSHLSVAPPLSMVYRERALTAGQAMAASKENLRTVAAFLNDTKAAALDEAIRLFETGSLARSDKFVAPVKWLRALHDRPKGKLGENVLWRAIATAPEGYCHPRASVIGPLLDDIVAGLPFAEIKAKFDAKLGPLFYQRPQAAPSAGNIRSAEELVAKLGLAPSLERRFARLDELQTVWLPAAAKETSPSGGVFGHLKSKGEGTVGAIDIPAVTVTWDKFTRTVLPTAQRLEILVPAHGRFIALTTAANADAPPILKWDHEDERNPVAWYVYPRASPASQWRLAGGQWAKINAIAPLPPMWGSRPMPFLGEGAVLVIDGASDTRTDCGNALFPECLREEIHGARSTIEAYSRSATLGDREQASACGYDIRKSAADCVLRSFANGAWTSYRIDRWD